MIQSDMVTAVNVLADDVVDTNTVVTWLNMGKDIMAQAANAKFPNLDPFNAQSTFVFDPEWHHCAVLYAVAKYKEMDTAVQEVGNYVLEFEQMKNHFAETYIVPVIYRNDAYSQQFGSVPTNPDGSVLFPTVTPLFPNGNTGYLAVGPTYTSDVVAVPQSYQITKESFIPYRSQLVVYVNNQKCPQNYITDNGDGSFSISANYTVKNTDQITATWNPVEDEISPPYAWWAVE